MTIGFERLATALGDRYRIERELGAGGMATVYLAQDIRRGRQVAVKVLKPELAAMLGAERFIVEIKTTAALQHPHILPLFDSGEADGFLYYVMPYIKGETIRERLNRETQFGIDDAVRITCEVADALDYAHRNGVIHRDIKPENILLHDGRAMVMDFGIALALSAAAGGRMTETGLSLGTPHYMSPEQATAEREISGRSDVYSLATVLYEMLAGNPPFTGAAAQQIIMKIITEPAEPVTKYRKTVSPNVAAALGTALEKLPADRFSSAAEFSRALVAKEFIGKGTAAIIPARAPRGAQSKSGLALAAVLCTAAGAAAGAVFARPEAVAPQVTRFVAPIPVTQVLNNNASLDMPIVVSPDGERIAYVAIDSGASLTRIHVRRLDELTDVSLPGTEDAVDPFFSPDGKWVGFITQRDFVVRKVSVTGGPVSVIVKGARIAVGSPSWGDDNSIVYVETSGNLMRIGPAGESPQTIVDQTVFGSIAAPRVLPGSKAALLMGCSTRGVCIPSLFAVDLRSGKTKQLMENARRGWYLPGGYLVFGTDDGALYGVAFDAVRLMVDADSMVAAHFEFGATTTVKRTTLFSHRPFNSGGVSVRGYDVSRDGKSFVFVRDLVQRATAQPIIVLNWGEEVRRLMAASQTRQ